VPCAETAGILFVSPRADVPLDIEAHLGTKLIEELSGWGLNKLAASRSEPIELPGNWKLVYDTFLDAYHFAAAHKNNLAAYFNSNIMTIDRFGKHLRVSVSYRTIADEYEKPAPEDRKPLSYLVVAYILFPGYVLINNPQILEMFRLFPKSVDHTTVQHACYSRMPLDVPANAAMFENIWQSAHNIVQNEDFPFGVTTAQKGLRSGSLKTLVFGKNELANQLNYQAIAQALAEAK
jgi:phenylpropionate dioxygenase-like ring-hydroxylating dioxygenase large terminal subunit